MGGNVLFIFCADAKPMLASTNRFVMRIENVRVVSFNHASGWF